MFLLRFKDNSQPLYPVVDAVCTLGRAQDNKLVLDTRTVDEHHAKLVQHEGKLFLQDNKSRIGSFVNGKKVRYKALEAGDVVTIGNVHFEITTGNPSDLPFTLAQQTAASIAPKVGLRSEPIKDWVLVSETQWLPGKRFPLEVGSNTIIGRGKDCQIVLPTNHLSRHHAALMIDGDRLLIRDMNSSNGSFLNEKKLASDEFTELVSGDRLRFDVYQFLVQGPRASQTPSTTAVKTSPAALNLESTLQNIEALRSQTYQEKQWITKPTSHGNRYHEVPTQKQSTVKTLLLVLGMIGVIAAVATLLSN